MKILTENCIFIICITIIVVVISFNNVQRVKLSSFNQAIDNCAGSSLCIESVGKAYRIKENGTDGVESTHEVLERIQNENKTDVRK